jgi:tetratricopeptide (TPR) repeat protein
MESSRGRPWTYTLTTSTGWPFGRYAIPCGLVYRILGDKKSVEDPAIDRGMLRWRLRDTMSARAAREPFERVVKDNYVQAYFARGAFRRSRHEHALALAHFERARRLGSPEAALNSGLHYFEMGNYDRAADCWRQAEEEAPRRPEPHANLALLALRARPPRPDAALALCERAMAADRNFVQAYEISANAWYMKGDVPQAVRSLERALVLKPGDQRLTRLLAAMRRGAFKRR